MTTLDIKDFDPDLKKALKVAAAQAGITQRNFITAALQHAVDHEYDPDADTMKAGRTKPPRKT